VPDLEAANLARERLSAVVEQPWQISTLGGQVITHLGGWARGSESTADRLVSLRRREMAAHSRLEELEGALDQAARRRAEAETGLSQAEKRELDLRADQFSAEAQTRSLSSRREDLGAQRRRLEDALASLGPPAQLVDSRAAVSGADNVSRRQELAQIASSLKDKERAATEALHELQARWEAAWSEREQARRLVERAAAERRAREEVAAARARELERLEEEKLTATEQAQRASVEQTAIRTRLQACEANGARLAAAIADVVGAFDDLAVRRSALGAASDELDAAVAALRRQLAEAQQSREGTLLSSQQAADELSRLREEADAMAEEWGLAGSAVVQLALTGANAQPASPPAGASLPAPEHGSAADEAVAPPEIDLVTTRRRLLALQRELRADGGPSESVLDEYREVDERLRFLKGQSADLRAAMQEMEDAIAELEGMMRREFTAAFERVNGAFGQTFARLFGGGTARLMLTDPDQPLQTGVEVVAQPPGKRLQNLMSLSGGERALTSTALIFALLAINPLPFCVLDEVDAALDESNARRFAALLQEYAQRTQFIIITHNRATMEIAAALYGISMGGDGVTTVVSLRPSEAFAYA
jgi:chromosome segregation protein